MNPSPAATSTVTNRLSVAVVGGGVIGLSAAWELAESGCTVDLFDEQLGLGASYAAAGMLAPVSEAAYDEEDLLAAGLESAQVWPHFAGRLARASGVDVGYRPTGSLLVGHDQDDARQLQRHAALLARHGLAAEPLTSRQTRALEPALSPRTTAGLHVPGDHSVDNRSLLRALIQAASRRGVRLHPHRAAVQCEPDRPGDSRAVGVRAVGVRAVGVRAADDSIHRADVVLVAAGFGSASVAGLPAHVLPPVRPVKGQILRLAGGTGLLTRTVRALVAGVPVYLVPRASGEIVVGATSEDVGLDARVTAGATLELLRAAIAVVPDVAELEVTESMARFRPASPDNAPLVGSCGVDGLLVATGHYRGGVLLAPVTARAVVDLVHQRPLSFAVRALTPQRFAHASATAPAPASATALGAAS